MSMQGKRGLIMGVANDHSIAWGIARAMHAAGAELAFSYQGEAFGKRVQPLAASVGSDVLVDVDVTNQESLDACFAALKERWGRLDFLVHAIAFSDKTELTGRFVNTTRGNFLNSLNISCFSFIDVARRAEALFQLGVAAHARDRSAAYSYWQQVVDTAQPTLVEYAAARNELARSAS